MRSTYLTFASEPGSALPGSADDGSADGDSAERPNEDFAAAALPLAGMGGAFVVLDGVTPPPDGDSGCRHSVAWFTGRLGGVLLEAAGADPRRPLTDCLAAAIDRVAAAHRDTCDLYHQRTPQATVVAARWDTGAVEYLVLSDSVLLIEETTGVHAVVDPALDRARETVRGLPPAERGARLERLRNAAGGFHTAAADPAVVAHAVTGTVPRARVRSLAGLSDGVGRWRDVFALGDWPQLLALLRDAGPAAAIEAVRAAERADPLGEAFPRGKPHDDATALFVGGL